MGGDEPASSMRCCKVSLPHASIGITLDEAERMQFKEFIWTFMVTKDVFIIFNFAKTKEA